MPKSHSARRLGLPRPRIPTAPARRLVAEDVVKEARSITASRSSARACASARAQRTAPPTAANATRAADAVPQRCSETSIAIDGSSSAVYASDVRLRLPRPARARTTELEVAKCQTRAYQNSPEEQARGAKSGCSRSRRVRPRRGLQHEVGARPRSSRARSCSRRADGRESASTDRAPSRRVHRYREADVQAVEDRRRADPTPASRRAAGRRSPPAASSGGGGGGGLRLVAGSSRQGDSSASTSDKERARASRAARRRARCS